MTISKITLDTAMLQTLGVSIDAKGATIGHALLQAILRELSSSKRVIVAFKHASCQNSRLLQSAFHPLTIKSGLSVETLHERLLLEADDPSLVMEAWSYIGDPKELPEPEQEEEKTESTVECVKTVASLLTTLYARYLEIAPGEMLRNLRRAATELDELLVYMGTLDVLIDAVDEWSHLYLDHPGSAAEKAAMQKLQDVILMPYRREAERKKTTN